MELADRIPGVVYPLVVKHTRTNHGIEGRVGEWRCADIGLLNIVHAAFLTERNSFGREINTDVPLRIPESFQDRARTAASIQDCLLPPIGQLFFKSIKDNAAQGMVPPARFLYAKQHCVFSRSH